MGGGKEGCGGGRGGGVDCEATSKPTGEKCDAYWNSEVSELLTASGFVRSAEMTWSTHSPLALYSLPSHSHPLSHHTHPLSPHTRTHSPITLIHSPLTLAPTLPSHSHPLSPHSHPLSHHHTHSYPYTHSSTVTLLILLASSRMPEGSSLLNLLLYNTSKRVHSIPARLFWTIYSAHTHTHFHLKL